MKKGLFLLLAMAILTQTGYCVESSTVSVFNELKNAVVQDITSTVTTGVNNVKIASYKVQLEQKKKELEEVQNSNTFFIIKYFREVSIRSKIRQLENDIKDLEEENAKNAAAK